MYFSNISGIKINGVNVLLLLSSRFRFYFSFGKLDSCSR